MFGNKRQKKVEKCENCGEILIGWETDICDMCSVSMGDMPDDAMYEEPDFEDEFEDY